nr:MAG TPA: hypothetical protein [Bacteriophage sp.]
MRNVRKPIPEWVHEVCNQNKGTIESKVILTIYTYLLDNMYTFTGYLNSIGMKADLSTSVRRMRMGKLPNIISLSKMTDIFTVDEINWLVHYWYNEYHEVEGEYAGKFIDSFVNNEMINYKIVDTPMTFHGLVSSQSGTKALSKEYRRMKRRANTLMYLAKAWENEDMDA